MLGPPTLSSGLRTASVPRRRGGEHESLRLLTLSPGSMQGGDQLLSRVFAGASTSYLPAQDLPAQDPPANGGADRASSPGKA